VGIKVLFILYLEVFPFGFESGWVGFSHLFFSSLAVSSGLVWDLGPTCLWPMGKFWKNVHIHGRFYI
jgi:hypothetical protein